MTRPRNLALLVFLAVLGALGCGQSLVDFPRDAPPVVLFTSPEDGATGVSPSRAVRATFSADMETGTLDTSTFTLLRDGIAVAATVSYLDRTATLTPEAPLAEDSTFVATLSKTVADVTGNELGSDFGWVFSTAAAPDTAAPSVLSTDPPDGSVHVAVDTAVRATFTEPVDPATLEGATFELTQGAMSVAGTVSYADTTLRFVPAADLLPGTPYTATISTAVTDLAGNAMVAEYTWTFSTGTPPVVISTNPVDEAFGVATDRAVEATFDVAMDPATIDDKSLVVRRGATLVPGDVTYAGKTATFTPQSPYPENAILTATVTTAARDTMGNALLHDFVWTFQTGSKQGLNGIDLGSASTFAILAFNTVTNVNNAGTIVTGDLGISPGAALVGFPPGEVVGDKHLGDPVAAEAKVDLLTAYNDAAGRLGAAVLPGDLSGLTLAPGLYKCATSTQLSAGNVTLDAQGDENAVFLFQIGSTFTSSPGTAMVLSGGAKAANVYWAVGTSATLGTNTISKGTFLAGSAITMSTGAALDGRLLALGAAVSLDTNLITVPSP